MRKIKALMAGLVLLLAGCTGTPEKEAVARERGVLTLWRARSEKYSAEDGGITPAQKQQDLRYWAAFESWVKEREEALKK